ncbi:unnamed protein product [Didymodactylos carnosus]|uniref:Uncharacterized protein n=1 Tax=Didymodactylos carnosus TaxID=1234261 RepID=A0A8S2U5H9_9BILA|nr:unnamed protein product [Didymodactylos carnosus]
MSHAHKNIDFLEEDNTNSDRDADLDGDDNNNKVAMDLDDQDETADSQLIAAENCFGCNPPQCRTITIPRHNKGDLCISYSYVSFTDALRNFLKLPEVQQDITELAAKPSTYPIMLDIHDGEFARTHPVFKTQDLLKIELNSDGLNITNAISNHIHKTFLFYWSLLNLRRDHRSLQASKRLVVACPKDDLTANFVRCLQKMAKDGVDVVINGTSKVYQVALFFTLGDYPAQQALDERK